MWLQSVLRPAPPSRQGSPPTPTPAQRWPGPCSEDAVRLAKTMKGGHRLREGLRPPREVLRKPQHASPFPYSHASQSWAWLRPLRTPKPRHPRPQVKSLAICQLPGPGPSPCLDRAASSPVSLPSQPPLSILHSEPRGPLTRRLRLACPTSCSLPRTLGTSAHSVFAPGREASCTRPGVASLCPLPSPEPE